MGHSQKHEHHNISIANSSSQKWIKESFSPVLIMSICCIRASSKRFQHDNPLARLWISFQLLWFMVCMALSFHLLLRQRVIFVRTHARGGNENSFTSLFTLAIRQCTNSHCRLAKPVDMLMAANYGESILAFIYTHAKTEHMKNIQYHTVWKHICN